MRQRTIDPDDSPEAAYGVQLRRSREAKGYTQLHLAELVPCHSTYISKIETAMAAPTRDLSRRFDELLETGGTLELMWRQISHRTLIEGLPEYVRLEERAVLLRFFDVWVVPGLLQSDEYTACLMDGWVRRGDATPQQAQERLSFQTMRKRILSGDPPPAVHAVLSESCLHRVVGDSSVMERQLRHLEELASRPEISLQILPFDRSDWSPFDKPVRLLAISDRTSVGYTETLERGFLQRDRDKVRAWHRAYDRLMAEALSPTDSVQLIRAARKELVNMAKPIELRTASWFKSSYSGGGGSECIEVAPGFTGVVPVRDSKDPHGPALVFTTEAFASFVTALKAGEFPRSE